MKFTELKNSIKEGAAEIYLLEGEDAYFRSKGEEMIKEAFLQMPELNYTAFDGESLKGQAINALCSAVRNYPFMAEKRVIKVSEFYPTDRDYETYLKPLFENFPQSTILIINNTGAKKTVDLKRKHSVTYVDCNRADPETVTKWIYITLRRAGITASAAVCENVANYCLCDMARVSVEVEKLIAYKGGGTLTGQEADALIYKDAEYKLYELTNTVPRKDYDKFCVIAEEIKAKGGDEMYVLNGLFNYFKNLLTILTSGGSDSELATRLKMKEYGVKKSREQARAIGAEKLSKLVTCLYGCVSDIKNGRQTPQNSLLNAKNAIFFGD